MHPCEAEVLIVMDLAEERQVPPVNAARKERVNCPLCGANKSDRLYMLEDYHTKQPGTFTLVQCAECGLVYLNPRPTVETMSVYYPATYRPHIPLVLEHLPWSKRWLVQYGLWKRCRPLLESHSSGKILDVGCGTGHFLAAMKKHGNWETIGVDLNLDAVTFAKDVLKIEAYVGNIEDIKFPSHTFDAVTMWDVLEHLYDPRQTLLEIRRVLKAKGQLLLRIPSLDSLDARLFGIYWSGLDAPRHLMVFSPKTLRRLLAETGFSIKRMWCMSGSHASFVISLRFLLTHNKQARWSDDLLLKILSSPLGHTISAPYFFLLDKFRLGPEITVLARKE